MVRALTFHFLGLYSFFILVGKSRFVDFLPPLGWRRQTGPEGRLPLKIGRGRKLNAVGFLKERMTVTWASTRDRAGCTRSFVLEL